jgi:hypothetical protein
MIVNKITSQDGEVSLLATLGRRNAEVHRRANRFRELFGWPLSKFWQPFTGFDIVRFDDVIRPAKNQSLRACVEAKYGEEAVRLIEYLIRA